MTTTTQAASDNKQTEPAIVQYIKFVGVSVVEPERALAFYTEKLGFVVRKNEAYGADRWIELELPGAQTRLLLAKGNKVPEGKPSLVLVAEDVQQAYELLKKKGVEFTQPPKSAPWGMHAIFRDSEDNLVLLGTA